MSSAPDPQLIKQSFEIIEPVADKVAGWFYAKLFYEYPALQDMFPPAMDSQRARLLRALLRIVQAADQLESLAEYIGQLGVDHRKFGVRPEHYEAVGRCLVSAVRRHVGTEWTADMEDSWQAVYRWSARRMIQAAEEAATNTPPWWTAEVLEHERRAVDLAVLRLAPDQPYPYVAGQYVSVETRRWPRVWRFYSIANAPRPDNTLEFHVRAVGAGWVSSTLVDHVRPGDLVKLGPPVGTMTLDLESPRDVVCLAGGSGLAPMKALVEGMAMTESPRRTHLFMGARRREDLYDMDAVLRIAADCPWLSVIPAVSHDESYQGERGLVPEVAARYGRWRRHDVYAAGSPAMIRATLTRFLELGVPLARIRYDAFADA
jgi:NAD(P)H-flavin reductase/hemoglobin-like flavoprotein